MSLVPKVDDRSASFLAVLDRAEESAVSEVQKTAEQFATFKVCVQMLFQELASENKALRGQLDASIAEEHAMKKIRDRKKISW